MYFKHGTIMAALLIRSCVECDCGLAGASNWTLGFRRWGAVDIAPTKSAADQAAEQSEQDFFDNLTPGGPGADPGAMAAKKFTTVMTTTVRIVRTTPERVSQYEDCDYLAYYCLKAYRTGKLCGRSVYYTYQSFTNYCLLDYVNCKEGYELWQVAHMGECFELEPFTRYEHYPYDDDGFLDQFYLVDD